MAIAFMLILTTRESGQCASSLHDNHIAMPRLRSVISLRSSDPEFETALRNWGISNSLTLCYLKFTAAGLAVNGPLCFQKHTRIPATNACLHLDSYRDTLRCNYRRCLTCHSCLSSTALDHFFPFVTTCRRGGDVTGQWR